MLVADLGLAPSPSCPLFPTVMFPSGISSVYSLRVLCLVPFPGHRKEQGGEKSLFFAMFSFTGSASSQVRGQVAGSEAAERHGPGILDFHRDLPIGSANPFWSSDPVPAIEMTRSKQGRPRQVCPGWRWGPPTGCQPLGRAVRWFNSEE